MLGFSMSEMLDTVEEALQEASAPILQSSQMAYQHTREKYPHLSILGTVALCLMIGFGVYRSHKRKAKEKEARKQGKVNAIKNGFESLSELSVKQLELFAQHVQIVTNIRERLDNQENSTQVPAVLYSANQAQTQDGSEQSKQLPKRPSNRMLPKPRK